MEENPLVGTWKLVSYSCTDDDGNVDYPLGPEATGYIIYTADGYMSVSMSAANRANYETEDLKGGTVEENAAAAETYIAYCGKYELHEDRVVHHIKLALFPNRIGTSQVRYYELSGGRIDLTTPPIMINGRLQTCKIVWERP